MQVAIFTDNDFNKVNGVTTVLSAVLAHAPADITARVYTSEPQAVARPDYLALKSMGVAIPFYREMRMYLPRFRGFLRAAMDDRIDLIHFTTPGPVGLAAMWVAAQMRVPMVGSFHTDLAEYTRLLSGSDRLGALMREYMRWPYGKCRTILVPSEATRALLVKGKINPAKIRTWSRGVSTERFAPTKRSDEMRSAWGVSSSVPAIIFVGRLSKEKGLDAFPVLQAQLRRAGIEHRLVFVGDGPMREELAARCPDAVFTGVLSSDDVAVAMASSDLFVFPSRTDTAGNVVLEAQASGLPVLVTDQGGPREHMSDRQTGYVCPQTADFSDHAISLLVDGERRRQMSRVARGYALTRSWASALRPLYDTYREALAEHQADATPRLSAFSPAVPTSGSAAPR